MPEVPTASMLTSARKIMILRALNLGDMLCAIPAMRALRAAAPRAEITLVGLPWASILLRRFPQYLDRFLVFPGFPGMPERRADLAAIPPFLAAMQAARIDLAIQLHGSGEVSNILVALTGAARTAGYRRLPENAVDPVGAATQEATPGWLAWQDGEHEILRCLRLMAAIGAPPTDAGAALTFPVTAADERLLQRTAGLSAPPGRLVVLHPGASLSSRRWPAARFAAVADALAQAGLTVALTGTSGEAALCQEVARLMRRPAQNLAGKTELGALAVLLRDARLLVSNDTGVAHLARAVGTPSVTICCGADPGRFAPLDASGMPVLSSAIGSAIGSTIGPHRLLWEPVACRPCMHAQCPIGHPCALGVTVDAVLDAVQSVLDPAGGTASAKAGEMAGRRMASSLSPAAGSGAPAAAPAAWAGAGS
jgi:ADP-heptose:LPS heptosyltransferase